MNVGLNINDSMRIKIGDSFEHITSTLESKKIDYKIPYMGKDEASDDIRGRSIVLFLDKYGVELNLLDDKVVYIKASDLKANTLFDITSTGSIAEVLSEIINRISGLFGILESNITVETFDGRRYSTVLRLKIDATHNVRVSIVCDAHNKAHIHTVRLLVK